MPWKIDHFETDGDDTHITSVAWYENGKRTAVFPLSPAIIIPPPGPDRGSATKALRQFVNALRHPPEPRDVSDIEDAMNAGGD